MMVAPRRRLDQALVERGLVASRERAQAMVRAGLVRVAGVTMGEPDEMVTAEQAIELAGTSTYVSRGGEKLAAGLDAFAIDPSGRTAVDVGASTGGFTDVLLQRGASRVHAVDVGYGQLHPKLRGDGRVSVHERVNARGLTPEILGERCAVAVADLSFISVRLVLPALSSVLVSPAFCVVLVKPQFEAGRAEVGKGGVVRDADVHARVVAEVDLALRAQGFSVLGTTPSPLLGPAGNREFLTAARR